MLREKITHDIVNPGEGSLDMVRSIIENAPGPELDLETTALLQDKTFTAIALVQNGKFEERCWNTGIDPQSAEGAQVLEEMVDGIVRKNERLFGKRTAELPTIGVEMELDRPGVLFLVDYKDKGSKIATLGPTYTIASETDALPFRTISDGWGDSSPQENVFSPRENPKPILRAIQYLVQTEYPDRERKVSFHETVSKVTVDNGKTELMTLRAIQETLELLANERTILNGEWYDEEGFKKASVNSRGESVYIPYHRIRDKRQIIGDEEKAVEIRSLPALTGDWFPSFVRYTTLNYLAAVAISAVQGNNKLSDNCNRQLTQAWEELNIEFTRQTESRNIIRPSEEDFIIKIPSTHDIENYINNLDGEKKDYVEKVLERIAERDTPVSILTGKILERVRNGPVGETEDDDPKISDISMLELANVIDYIDYTKAYKYFTKCSIQGNKDPDFRMSVMEATIRFRKKVKGALRAEFVS